MTHHLNPHRDKLGMALAGGGFRATLFHIGAFRRLAELDMLRYVEVLSTVSGGSIAGALYILLLKRDMDRKARLEHADYLNIVDELEQRLCRAIQKNLRIRLFLNPFGILRAMLTGHSLGKRMARLYERCIYADVIRQFEQDICPTGWSDSVFIPAWLQRRISPGRLCLNDIKIRPGGKPITDGIESYNRRQVEQHGSVITQLIINATSLNSGTRFWFSATEIGDWDYGNIRRDEIDEILHRKQLLHNTSRHEQASAGAVKDSGERPELAVRLARWWQQASYTQPVDGLEQLFDEQMTPVIAALCRSDLGTLRLAKLPAWYLRIGSRMPTPITGGLSPDQHLAKAITVIAEIAHLRRDLIDDWMSANPRRAELMLDLVYELFLLRLAENTSPNIRKEWDNMTLGEAVGASANFPPVFAPYPITGIYDDIVVSRIGLTDGGVFDNIGITGLIDEHCTHIIASDTGVPLKPKQRSASGRLGMAARIISILMNREITLSKKILLDRYRISSGLAREIGFISCQYDNSGTVDNITQRLDDFHDTFGLHRLALFSIDADGVERQPDLPFSAADLVELRTDLDAFGDIEMYALMNQGYQNADHFIRQYMGPAHQPAGPPSPDCHQDPPPYVTNPDADWDSDVQSPWYPALTRNRKLVQRTLRCGRKRFFRALRMGLLPAWFASLIVVAVIVWSIADVRISIDAVADSIKSIDVRHSLSLLAFLPENALSRSVSLIGVITTIAVVVLMGYLLNRFWFALVDKLKQHSWIRLSRLAARLGRWPQSYRGNLLWGLWLYLPFILTGITTAVMWFSHICYHLPLMRKTRIDRRRKEPR